MRTQTLLALLIPALFAGCASTPATRMPAPDPTPNFAAPIPRPVPPQQALSEQILYETLLAEVAAQRGNFALATQAYQDLLKLTNDYRYAERGTQLALNARAPDQALALAERWLELEPNSIAARQTMAGVLVSKGQIAAAKPHLEKILVAEGGNVGFAFLHLHNLLARHGNKTAVLELVSSLASAYPNLPEAHFAVARAAWAAGNKEIAVQESTTALALRSDWEGAALFKAQVLQSMGSASALAFYQAYLDSYPSAREMRLAYARLLVQEKQFGPARDAFKQLAADFPNNNEVLMAIGLLSLQLNEYDTAEQYLTQALQMGVKDDDAVRLYLGQLNEERKRFDLARKWYEAVSGTQALAARLRIASVMAKQGQLAEARTYLQQLEVANNEQRVQTIQAEAMLLRDAKQYQASFDVLSKGLEKLPNHPELLYDHAMAAEKIDRVDVLESDLKKLLLVKPDHAHALNALGYTLADRTTRYDEAKQYLERALKLKPDDPFILDSMGWLMYRTKEYGQAVTFLRHALSVRPDPEIAAHLGEVLWVSGSRDEARQVWASALKENPGHESLTGTMLRLQSK